MTEESLAILAFADSHPDRLAFATGRFFKLTGQLIEASTVEVDALRWWLLHCRLGR